MIGKWCSLSNALKPKKLEAPETMAKRKEASSSDEIRLKSKDSHWILEEIRRKRAFLKKENEKWDDLLKKLNPIVNRLIKSIVRMITIGVICNIIASSLWPEFPEEHPAIFGWFDGWLQFGEFVYKSFFKGIYAIFIGNFKGFRIEFANEVKELFHQFVNWLSTLKF